MKKVARKRTTSSPDSHMTKRFDAIDAKLDRVIDTVTFLPTRAEFSKLTDRVSRIEETLEKVLTSIDKLTKSVQDIVLENAVMRQQFARYDRWFKEISERLGIELKP